MANKYQVHSPDGRTSADRAVWVVHRRRAKRWRTGSRTLVFEEGIAPRRWSAHVSGHGLMLLDDDGRVWPAVQSAQGARVVVAARVGTCATDPLHTDARVGH